MSEHSWPGEDRLGGTGQEELEPEASAEPEPVEAEAAPQTTRHIVLTTTLPGRELTRRTHPRLARIQAQSFFVQTDCV